MRIVFSKKLFSKKLKTRTDGLFLKLTLRKHKRQFSILIIIDLAHIEEIEEITLHTSVIVVKIALIDQLTQKKVNIYQKLLI